jgi:hypothetical protein
MLLVSYKRCTHTLQPEYAQLRFLVASSTDAWNSGGVKRLGQDIKRSTSSCCSSTLHSVQWSPLLQWPPLLHRTQVHLPRLSMDTLAMRTLAQSLTLRPASASDHPGFLAQLYPHSLGQMASLSDLHWVQRSPSLCPSANDGPA